MSYASADSQSAETLTYILEDIGHEVVMAGGQITEGTDLAAVLQGWQPTHTTVAVLSPRYLAALSAQPAAAELVRAQATARPPALVAVRVRECTPGGLLPGVSYVNLVGADQGEQEQRLRAAFAAGDGADGKDGEVPIRLHEVFTTSGVPPLDFVETEGFEPLKVSLRLAHRGIVIEGPSGIGKTTMLRRARESLPGEPALREVTDLHAGSAADAERIRSIETWHRGTVVIDDFHRLDEELRHRLATYAKLIADAERKDIRLVLVGTPAAGLSLISESLELGNRIELVTLHPAPDEIVLTMIERGERALNVSLTAKDDIVRIASGSLQIAQILCYEVCAKAGVDQRQARLTPIDDDVASVVERVRGRLDAKFGDAVLAFEVAGADHEDIGRRLLIELARSAQRSLSLVGLRQTRPYLAHGIQRFIDGDFIDHVRRTVPAFERHIRYNPAALQLTFDDPQLAFYLRATFGVDRNRVFVSYSHKDRVWFDRLQVHLAPLQHAGVINQWNDTMVGPGEDWTQEIVRALKSANVVVLLVSADFLASEFIAENELAPVLDAAREKGTKIQTIVVAPCAYENSPLGRFQAINDPGVTLMGMGPHAQEAVFRDAAKAVKDAVEGVSDR